MKFEYEADKSGPACVAYIQGDESEFALYIKTTSGVTAMYSRSGIVENYGLGLWDPDAPENVKKFYPGDKMTITF